jgi:phospholipase C
MRLVAFLLLCLLAPVLSSPIKHVVVLMMENRSFDHLLGFLSKDYPKIDGLTGSPLMRRPLISQVQKRTLSLLQIQDHLYSQ